MQLERSTSQDLHPKDNHNIIENLPSELKQACLQFNDQVEKEVVLYSGK